MNDVDVFEYLDGLRESGVTNMFGARPYIVNRFNLSSEKSTKYLGAWMGTFDPDKTALARALEAKEKGLI